MLEASGISVHLGGSSVLRDVSAALQPGEVVAVVGPNGAGKSTLLAALSGAQAVTSGAVRIDGAPLDQLSAADLSLRRAVLEQTPVRNLPFTPRTLLGLAADKAVSPQALEQIIERALTAVGLHSLAEQPVQKMSGGQAHRVHLARALVQLWAGCSLGFGGYLLIDEPTASLDLIHQRSVFDIARRAADEGSGVLIILHDLTLAAAVSDRIIVLHNGRIAAQGAPRSVLTPATLADVYGVAIDTAEIGGTLAILPRFYGAPIPQSEHHN